MSRGESGPANRTATISVHIDELEYTRSGLRTREALSLEVGYHHRISIVRPDRIRPLRAGSRGFPHDSAFPLIGTLSLFWSMQGTTTAFAHDAGVSGNGPDASSIFQIFGHTSASGDEAYNKDLSERRADAGVALLTGDATPLLEVAHAENWGLRERQVLLRYLACNPGPADDEPGKLTARLNFSGPVA